MRLLSSSYSPRVDAEMRTDGLLRGNPILAERRRAARAYRVGEVEFLTSVGLPLQDAVAAVGWSLSAAEIAARRTGRHKLAVALDRARGRQK